MLRSRMVAVLGAGLIGLVAAPIAQATFSHAGGSPFATGGASRGVAMADLDGDSDLDLALVNGGSGDVSILLGNNMGGFAPAAGSPIATGGAPQDIAVGNLNGAGGVDLAVADGASSNLFVLAGNGNGTFGAPAGVATGIGPPLVDIEIGQLDGAAGLDLAVSGSSNVSVLLGDGAGVFAPAPGFPGAGGGLGFALLNLDGDADLDFAPVAGGAPPTDFATTFLGNGDGTFTGGGTGYSTGGPTSAIEAGSFNGDTRPDVAVGGGTLVGTMLGDGSGGLIRPTGSPVGAGPTGFGVLAIAVGNLVGNSAADVAAPLGNGTSTTLSVMRGSGNGGLGLEPGMPIAAGGSPLGAPGTVAVGDVNGDTYLDVAIALAFSAGGQVAVLLNDPPSFGFAPTSLTFAPNQPTGTVTPPLGVQLTNTGSGETVAVSDVRTTGTHRDDFLISDDTCTGETIPMGGTCNVRVRFAPSSAGPKGADLEVRYDSPVSPQTTVPLSGTGDPPPGAPGAPGVNGAPGPQGPAGAQGPPGRDATVTCKPKGRRVKCSVAFTASKSSKRATARLSRDGVTYARGNAYVDDGRARVPLVVTRELVAGRYVLTVKVAYGKGKTATTRRSVTVG